MNNPAVVWIDAGYFFAGMLIGQDGRVTEAAPILRWTIGRKYTDVLQTFNRKSTLRNWGIIPPDISGKDPE